MIPSNLLASDFYGLALELFVLPFMVVIALVGVFASMRRWRAALIICGVLLLLLSIKLGFDYAYMRGASQYDSLTITCATVSVVCAVTFFRLSLRRRDRPPAA
jgi:NADH:ubiquinone oxidoreductase subunit 2 (subunit N)